MEKAVLVGNIQEDISCTKEVKKGDVIELRAAQYACDEATINSAGIQINYFPTSVTEPEPDLDKKSETERVLNLENKVFKLENKTKIKNLYKLEQNISIPTSELVKVASITIPEDCYADIYGSLELVNDSNTSYKGIFIYHNGTRLYNNGKGGTGAKTTESISCTKELKEGDVIDLYVSQYTGATKNLNWASISIYYMPLTEVEKEEASESGTLKERIEELQTKISALENKTTMKNLVQSCNNVTVASGVSTKLLEITIPEDCYADIYGFYAISNNNNIAYKGIWIYKNEVFLAGNGKGGTGSEISNAINCMTELKKGDVITLYCDQYTGVNQTVRAGSFRINYFVK